MRNVVFALSFVLLFSFAILPERANAGVAVDPDGFSVFVEPEDTLETEITLTNAGEEALNFRTRFLSVNRQEEGMQRGPRRDDPGDVLEQIELDHPGALGIGRDYVTGDMWVCHTLLDENGFPNGGMYTGYHIEDGEWAAFAEIEPDLAPLGGCYYDGVLYGTSWQNMYVTRWDVEGNNLGNFDVPHFVMGCAVDPERGYLFVIVFEEVDILVYDIENDLAEMGMIADVLDRGGDADFRGRIYWAPEHEEGHLWMSYEWNAYQLDVQNEEDEWTWEEVQHFEADTDVRSFGIGHDGRDLWIGNMNENTISITDDGIHEPNWLMVEPEEGELPAGEPVELTATIAPGEELEAGVYEMMLQFQFDDPDMPAIEMSVVMALETLTANITGMVYDEATDEALEDVQIEMDFYNMSRLSGEDGEFEFANLPEYVYGLTFTKDDYLPMTVDAELGDDDVELEVGMLHAQFNPSVENITYEIAPDEAAEYRFQAGNDGNGRLEFTAERALEGGADAEPWEIREAIMIGQEVEDNRIEGVVFAGGNYYVSGAHDRDPMIYVLNRDGEQIDMIEQPTDDRRGMRDLAWDGETLWGGVAGEILGIDLEGEEVARFEGEYNPISAIAYDHVNEYLWYCGTTTDILAVDREGNQIEGVEIDRQDLRIYGLAYWAGDPDGYPLYIFHKDRETDQQAIHKCDPGGGEDGMGEMQFVTFLEPENGGSPNGAFITNQYDIYSWTLMSISSASDNEGGDRIDVWQLDTRMDWFTLDPMEGAIEAGEELEFTVNFNAEGLPPERFRGTFTFTHNGRGDETVIPVTMNVVEGPVQAERTLELDLGWNMVSFNLQPDVEDIPELMQPLVEEDLLLMMKNGEGQFYAPEFGFNNIPGWFVNEGYMMKMRAAAEFTAGGMTVVWDEPMALIDGWNMIAYYPRDPIDAIVALSGIRDQLIMAKDGEGRFYIPDWDFSNMGDMREGQGYLVKVDGDVEFAYRMELPDEENAAALRWRASPCYELEFLPRHANTGANMSLLIFADESLSGEVGVYSGGRLAGSGVLKDGVCGIAVWGDDPTTEEIDGAVKDSKLNLKLFDENLEIPVQVKVVQGEMGYETNSFVALELNQNALTPGEFALAQPYPNPFNSAVKIGFSLDAAGETQLNIYDSAGRLIDRPVNRPLKAGQYSIAWQAVDYPSGLYFAKLVSSGKTKAVKLMLVK